MGIDQFVDLLAAAAGAGGVAVAFVMWRRATRARARRRSQHPATAVPVSLSIAQRPDGARWRVEVDARWPSTSIDIVTYRLAGTDGPWMSEPIVEPVEVDSGGSVLLDSVLPDESGPYDIVLGWTAHHETGDTTGSTTTTVPRAAVPAGPDDDDLQSFRVVYPAVAALLALVGFVAVLQFADASTSDAGDEAAPGPTTPISTGPETHAATTIPHTPSTPQTAPPATTPGTAPSGTSPPATPATAPTTVAPPPNTTAPATTTTPPIDGPRVEIDGRVEDCRFGADCVIAGFRIVDFVGSGEYVCEFDDGSRFVFRYVGDGADDACARSGPAPTITIEVDGIRSATISRESLTVN